MRLRLLLPQRPNTTIPCIIPLPRTTSTIRSSSYMSVLTLTLTQGQPAPLPPSPPPPGPGKPGLFEVSNLGIDQFAHWASQHGVKLVASDFDGERWEDARLEPAEDASERTIGFNRAERRCVESMRTLFLRTLGK